MGSERVGVAMSVRDLAARRNAASVRSFMDRLDKALSERSMAEPISDMLLTHASERLAKVRELSESARAFIGAASARRSSGMLDAETEAAEILPARTIIALSEYLERALEKAKSSPNSYSIRRVKMALGVLEGYASSPALAVVRYPEHDSLLVTQLTDTRKGQAADIYADVCLALKDAPQMLGLPVPEIQSPP